MQRFQQNETKDVDRGDRNVLLGKRKWSQCKIGCGDFQFPFSLISI
jgi:hypothetical protein